jgi:GntR family transcriptional regulator
MQWEFHVTELSTPPPGQPQEIAKERPARGLDVANQERHYLSMEIDKQGAESYQSSPIEFRLDPGSGVPTYLQLVQQVERALRLGYLVTGDRLPKVKEVVASLAINPNTVLKAYRELEHKGLAAGRPGQGTFIEGTLEIVPLKDQQALRRGLVRWLSEATKAGLDEEGIAALVASALHDLRQSGEARAS